MASDIPQSNLLTENPVRPTINSSPMVRAPTPLCEYGPVSLMYEPFWWLDEEGI